MRMQSWNPGKTAKSLRLWATSSWRTSGQLWDFYIHYFQWECDGNLSIKCLCGLFVGILMVFSRYVQSVMFFSEFGNFEERGTFQLYSIRFFGSHGRLGVTRVPTLMMVMTRTSGNTSH